MYGNNSIYLRLHDIRQLDEHDFQVVLISFSYILSIGSASAWAQRIFTALLLWYYKLVLLFCFTGALFHKRMRMLI